jgi:hypothetical protein
LAAALLASGSGADLIPIWWRLSSRPVGPQHPLDRHVRHLDPMTITDHLGALAQAAAGRARVPHGGDRRLGDGIGDERAILTFATARS